MFGVVLLIKNLLFTVIVPGTVGVLVPLMLVVDRAHVGGVFGVLSLILFSLGVATYTWCVWDFATFGKGTPAPVDAPKKLVVRGLYQVTRNPMYVGVLMVILGWATRFQSVTLLIYAGIVAVCFHAFIVLYEEPHLEREFGGEYSEYRSRVARWLPSLR